MPLPFLLTRQLNFPLSLRDPPLLLPSIVSGLTVYFDRALGANLLYRFERPQFAEVRRQYKTGQQVIIGQEKEVSAVYGAEHLLRMIGEFYVLSYTIYLPYTWCYGNGY